MKHSKPTEDSKRFWIGVVSAGLISVFLQSGCRFLPSASGNLDNPNLDIRIKGKAGNPEPFPTDTEERKEVIPDTKTKRPFLNQRGISVVQETKTPG